MFALSLNFGSALHDFGSQRFLAKFQEQIVGPETAARVEWFRVAKIFIVGGAPSPSRRIRARIFQNNAADAVGLFASVTKCFKPCAAQTISIMPRQATLAEAAKSSQNAKRLPRADRFGKLAVD